MKIELKKNVEKVIRKRIKHDNQFSSVQKYVDYILKQVVEKLERQNSTPLEINQNNEKKVEEKLKQLGYLD